MKYTNPIIEGFYPDPSICRAGQDYYLVNSSFGYFPGVPIFHSTDLVNWEQIGHCLSTESQLPLFTAPDVPKRPVGRTGGYAPTIRFHEGKFYMITSNRAQYINIIVSADDPKGPWSEPLTLEWGGIDPSLYFGEDGKVYVTGTAEELDDEEEGIYQAEIDLQTGKLLSEQRIIWKGTGGGYPEGPHLYKINNMYYLMISEGGTEYGHMITVARSDQPYGTFVSCPHNPILSHRSQKNAIQATGHADLVQAHDGSWWTVCLGIRPSGYPYYHHLGRETFLSPVTWSEDGWPVAGEHGRIDLEMEGPAFFKGYTRLPFKEMKDNFNDSKLGFNWNSIRNPFEATGSLDYRPGWLTLFGTPYGLDDKEAQAFVGCRQRHFDCEVSTLLEFDPQEDGEQAGLTVFMNELGHYDIGMIRKEGRTYIIFSRRVGSIKVIERQDAITVNEVILSVRANANEYSFAYTAAEGIEIEIGRGECRYIATEVAGGFTGVYFGMYATGQGKASKSPACFDFFAYKRL